MLVMINRGGGWSLGFANSAWNLQTGQRIPLSMTFDGQNPWSGSAAAINEHMVTVPMAGDSALINAFRGAYQLQVQAAGRTFPFNLGGTSRLMVQLAQCVSTQLAIERGEPSPHFAAAPPRPLNPPAPPTSMPPAPTAGLELAATRIASNLLLQSKLPNARLLDPSETPDALRGHGVAWTSDAGAGAVALVSASAGKDPQQVASSVITNDATACKGDFASGRSSELVDDNVVTKAFTGCKDSAGARASRYFILRAPDGGFIVYVVGGSGAGNAPQQDGSPLADTPFQAAAVKAAFKQ